MGRQRRIHCMASMLTRFESPEFVLWRHLKTFVYAALVHKETLHHHTGDACQTTPASLNGCNSPWWDMSRHALNLREDILSPYYKCFLLAITHKLSVSGHILISTFFGLVCGTGGHSLSTPFSYTLYVSSTCLSFLLLLYMLSHNNIYGFFLY
jgi:hypothetical protein